MLCQICDRYNKAEFKSSAIYKVVNLDYKEPPMYVCLNHVGEATPSASLLFYPKGFQVVLIG